MNDKLILYSNEDKPQLSEVKAKTKLPPGTFKETSDKIVRAIKSKARNKDHAVKMINFYINRAGSNLTNKTEVLRAKKVIENSKEFSDDYYDKVKKVASVYKSKSVYNDKLYPSSYEVKKRYKVTDEEQKELDELHDKLAKDAVSTRGKSFRDLLIEKNNRV